MPCYGVYIDTRTSELQQSAGAALYANNPDYRPFRLSLQEGGTIQET